MSRIKKIQKALDKRRAEIGWHPFYFEAMDRAVAAYVALSRIPAHASEETQKEMYDTVIERYVRSK